MSVPVQRQVKDQPATAPYNFVPLPEAVLRPVAPADVRSLHGRIDLDRRHGEIELRIEALSPLFARGPSRTSGGRWDDRPARERELPWLLPSGDDPDVERPVLPGASLRGMLRALVEVLAFAAIQPVSPAQLFYREVAARAEPRKGVLGDTYRRRMTSGDGPVAKAGYANRMPDGRWIVHPAVRCLRVTDRTSGAERVLQAAYSPQQTGSRGTPDWTYQHRRCWAQGDSDDRATHLSLSPPGADGGGWLPGRLVLTGRAPNWKDKQKREFTRAWFFDDPVAAAELAVPDDVIRAFHSDEQLSYWQEDAFPPGKPDGVHRGAKGHLRDGEPVFFTVDGSQVRFLGRARYFRVPYERGPSQLLRDAGPDPDAASLDLAEAVFGRVGEDALGTLRGRVFVEDAVADVPWSQARLGDGPVVPGPLLAPKPTTFAHYLVQGTGAAEATYHAAHEGKTAVRGTKRYWHRDAAERSQGASDPAALSATQTRLWPVRAGVSFAGRVRFENLDDIELGALLASVELPEGCAHQIGMGKPLGMGSVRVQATVHLVDHGARASSWAADGTLPPDRRDDVAQRCRGAFETRVLEHARATGEHVVVDGRSGLRTIARIDDLFELLEHTHRPSRDDTSAMDLEAFKEWRVLPTPRDVRGRDVETSKPTATAVRTEDGRSGRPLQKDDEVEVLVTTSTTNRGKPRGDVDGEQVDFHPSVHSELELTPGSRHRLRVQTPRSGANRAIVSLLRNEPGAAGRPPRSSGSGGKSKGKGKKGGGKR